MILIVSYPEEDHSIEVIKHLNNAGAEVKLISLSDFPIRSSVESTWDSNMKPTHIIHTPDGSFNLNDVHVVWWRRIVPFEIDPKINRDTDRVFSESETSQAVYGILSTLDCPWVNPNLEDEAAHRKPLQWEVAHRIGMNVPRTLVTNKPDAAKDFIKQLSPQKTVFKAFLASTEDWRETRIIEASDMNRLNSVQYAPVIFQEYIEGVDLRITVIGDMIFTGEIDASKTSYPFDMRMVIGEAGIKAVELPKNIQKLILKLMRKLGLTYGAIDMRRTSDGKYIFLEINPAGQWLFVEEQTGLPISKAIADYLISTHDNYSKK